MVIGLIRSVRRDLFIIAGVLFAIGVLLIWGDINMPFFVTVMGFVFKGSHFGFAVVIMGFLLVWKAGKGITYVHRSDGTTEIKGIDVGGEGAEPRRQV
jgi:hypothetical protein